MKKLPAGAEASNVLIGEVDFLQHHITAFVRLKSAVLLGDLTEVTLAYLIIVDDWLFRCRYRHDFYSCCSDRSVIHRSIVKLDAQLQHSCPMK